MSLTMQLLGAIKQALSHSTPCVLVTVTDVKGSAPRGVGTPMLVLPHAIQGTIGGGRLEYVAMDKARAAIESSSQTPFRERFPLGDSLGQCCGGSVELLFEPVRGNWQQWVNAAQRALENNCTYERVVDENYTHVITPLNFHLILCGAGHVGRALVRVLANAPITIHWLDERECEFPEDIPSNVLCEVTDTAAAVIDQAPAGCAVLITTHRHDLDFELAATALALPYLAYCGLIGSRSKRARFERQWRQKLCASTAGASDDALAVEAHNDALARLVCPIGGGVLKGKEPEVVAIAVAFEVLQTLQETLQETLQASQPSQAPLTTVPQ